MWSSPRALMRLGALAALCGGACSSRSIDGFAGPPVTSRAIGPEGGQVVDSAGGAVRVPAGALAAPVTIGIQSGPLENVPTLPATLATAGTLFALTPHNTSFRAPVTVHLPIDSALAAQAAGRPLRIWTAVPGGAWAPVDSTWVAGDALEAEVTHFSYFVVGFENPGQTLPAQPGRKLDMLFVIDDSTSMAPLQQKLIASFPTLIQTLKNLPGGLPDLHIGVVSSNMGAGLFTDIPQCSPGGERAVLQSAGQGTSPCALHDRYIAAGENEATKNYEGTIEEVFSCMAAIGERGCGFEHQLESAAVALGARGEIPAANAGFLRADAMLALVLITNEDDCSASPAGGAIFDFASSSVYDPYGPLTSYRCNEYGHVCAGGVRPPRVGDAAAAVSLAECHSAEDGTLNRISDYAQVFKGLKPDPEQVFIAAIAGPPTPYSVTFAYTPEMGGETWPAIEHSCTTATGEFADPAVRIADLVTAFGANGTFSSICEESLAPALTGIGAAISRGLGPACVQSALLDAAAVAGPALRAGCGVYQSIPAEGGMRTESELSACPAAGTGTDPCWTLVAEPSCTESGAKLEVTRSQPAPTGAVLVVRCED